MHAKKQELAELFTYQVLSIAPPLPSPLISIALINEDNVTLFYHASALQQAQADPMYKNKLMFLFFRPV